MTASKTVMYFGFYLYLTAAQLLFAPNMLLGMLGVPHTNEPWIRIVGVLVGCLGVYYHLMGRAGFELFARVTVFVRLGVLASFVLLWLAHIAPPQLIVFGVIDALAAGWTFSALKKTAQIA